MSVAGVVIIHICAQATSDGPANRNVRSAAGTERLVEIGDFYLEINGKKRREKEKTKVENEKHTHTHTQKERERVCVHGIHTWIGSARECIRREIGLFIPSGQS